MSLHDRLTEDLKSAMKSRDQLRMDVIRMIKAAVQYKEVELKQDLDDAGTPPAAWTAFRDKLRNVDGIAIATPEYNRSMPGALKNAIDVGSRPWGKSIWAAKPVGVISASVGAVGGFAGNHNVRQTMVTLNAPVMPGPEVYIGNGAALIGEDGKVNNEKTKEVLAGWAQAFAKWVEANGHKG